MQQVYRTTSLVMGILLPMFVLAAALSGPRPVHAGPLEQVVPGLNSQVTQLRFFESGPDLPPQHQRLYLQTFAAQHARHINWELSIDHVQPRQRVDFRLSAIYYQPDGSELTRHVLDSHVDRGWRDSKHASGYGFPTAGHWSPGSYRVDIFVDERIVASGRFSVTAVTNTPSTRAVLPPVHAGSPPVKSAPPPVPPEDLGEL